MRTNPRELAPLLGIFTGTLDNQWARSYIPSMRGGDGQLATRSQVGRRGESGSPYVGTNKRIPTAVLVAAPPLSPEGFPPPARPLPAVTVASAAVAAPALWLPYREACQRYGLTRSGMDRLRRQGRLDVRYIPCHGLRVSVVSLQVLFGIQ